MRITKKVVSLVLAIMMVTAMMSVMATTAFAATEVSTADQFQAAFGANGTVKLTADIDFGHTASWSTSVEVDGVTATLDLNGHTITGEYDAGKIIRVKNGADLTITDTSAAKSGKIFAQRYERFAYAVQVNNNSTVRINDGTLEGYGNTIYINEAGTVYVNGGTIQVTNESPAIGFNGAGGVLNVTGGHIIGKTYAIFTADGYDNWVNISGGILETTGADKSVITICRKDYITITGGTFIGDYVMQAKLTTTSSTVEISGGDFTGCDKVIQDGTYYNAFKHLTGDNAIEVSGGSFPENITEPLSDGTYSVTLKIDEDFTPIVNNGNTYVVPNAEATNAVAVVGGHGYETLAAAIAAAGNGETITMLANQSVNLQMSAGEKFTIDLNSYTMTVTSTSSTTNYNYIRGDLTIEDNSAAQTGKVIVNSEGIVPRDNTGKVTVNSGSFTTAASKYYIFYLMGGELEVNGGSFTAPHPVNCYSSYNKAYGGKVVINDGSFKSTEYFVVSGFENSDITINGGEFEGPYPIYVDKTSTLSSGYTSASATITGGTFTATAGGEDRIVECDHGTSVTITGGNFTQGELFADDNASTISVSGGSFSDDSAYKFIEDGAFVTKDENDKLVVSEDIPTATTSVDASDFSLGNFSITNYEILGSQESVDGSSVRFVTAVNEGFLKGANIEDYGYVLAKASGLTMLANGDKLDALKYEGGNGEKTVSCKGSSNTLSGNYGKYSPSTTYKFVTAVVNNMSAENQAVARFYIKTTDGKIYYADYNNGTSYDGLIAPNAE